MYDLHLSAEQREFRDTVRSFVTREVKPTALKAERLEAFRRPLLHEILAKASQIGLRTMALSEENGGAGADNLTCCMVTEELATGDVDVAAVLMETAALGRLLFDRLMTSSQRKRFLPDFLANDRYHLAFADHEPGVDTPLAPNYHRPVVAERLVTTRAVREGNGDWIINGAKDCVLNAPVAKLFIVQAATNVDGLEKQECSFLVPRSSPGLSVRELDQAERRYHGAAGEVVLSECRVPADDLLGSSRKGGAILTRDAIERNGQEQALNLGIGRAAYETALEYAKIRIQGGRPIIEHQSIGTKLAEIAVSLEVARSIVWQAAYASDHPDAVADRSLADLPLQTIAKVFTSTAMYRVTKDAAEVFGGMGVMRDMPLPKFIHDALICLHAGYGNSDAKLRLAEKLAMYRQ